jgi:uncharacterized membrane protein (DUF106 family)
MLGLGSINTNAYSKKWGVNILAGFLEMLLAMPPVLLILLVSLVISVVTVIIYKYTTNQQKLKSIQDEQKSLRDDMKKYQNNPDKAMKLQKRAMELSMEVMPESMKSMIFTFIPVIIIFGWLSANLSYMPIMPGETFTSTVTFDKIVPGKITLNTSDGLELLTTRTQDITTQTTISWQLKGPEGKYHLFYTYGFETYNLTMQITGGRQSVIPVLGKQQKILFLFPSGIGIPEQSNIKQIRVDMKPIRPLGQSFNLFGWYPGWLSIYIISSLVFTSLFRKYMKVY